MKKREQKSTQRKRERIRMVAVMGDAQHEACFLSVEEEEREGERQGSGGRVAQ